jgi:hypothetical protein
MTAHNHALADVLEAEIAWFGRVLARRLAVHFAQEGAEDPASLDPPVLSGDTTYGAACGAAGLDRSGRLALILALLPWLRPQALDMLSIRNPQTERAFGEFGMIVPAPGAADAPVPSRATALFVIAGDDLAARLAATALFANDAPLVRHGLLAPQGADHDVALPLAPHPALVARLAGIG